MKNVLWSNKFGKHWSNRIIAFFSFQTKKKIYMYISDLRL